MQAGLPSPLQIRHPLSVQADRGQDGSLRARCCTTPGDPGLFRRLAYHLVINNFTDPQSLEGLTIESCASFLNGPHETTAMLRSIATGTSIAEENRNSEAAARTVEFRWAAGSIKMADAWAVTEHMDADTIKVRRPWHFFQGHTP